MCGIAGWVSDGRAPIDVGTLGTVSRILRHRGPDDEGYLLYRPGDLRGPRALGGPDSASALTLAPIASAAYDATTALVHRRLSIIDLSPAGHQPMVSADGRYWIVYNGEIYNYVELRAELEAQGASFRSDSDTEVLLAAYGAWGERALPRLVGMFAFAILDVIRDSLFLARDPLGIKPLYYAAVDGQFAFASEIKGLLALPFVTRRGAAAQAYQFLRFGERSADGSTPFANVRSLPAAHCMDVALRSAVGAVPRQYWSVRTTSRRNVTAADAAAELRHLLEESVRLHLRSDVPVGACLSGGLDSSVLVRLASRQLTPARMHAFSFLSEEERFSEERWVDMIREPIVHKIRPTADDFAADIADLVAGQDLPFMNLGVYAQFRVFRLAQENGIKVMLDGQGSDELFGGYASLMGVRLTSLLARGRLFEAWRLARALPDTVPLMRLRTLVSSFGRQLPTSLQMAVVDRFAGGVYPRWMRREWFEARGVAPALRAHGRGREAFREELALGVEHLTLPQLLRYEDTNSMRHSIESRVPFCTPALAEFAFSLPDELLISSTGVTKSVLRHAAADIVPREIIHREKLGFHAPDRRWLRAARDVVMPWIEGEAAEHLPFLDAPAARREIEQALASDGFWPPHVWSILGFAGWSKSYAVDWS